MHDYWNYSVICFLLAYLLSAYRSYITKIGADALNDLQLHFHRGSENRNVSRKALPWGLESTYVWGGILKFFRIWKLKASSVIDCCKSYGEIPSYTFLYAYCGQAGIFYFLENISLQNPISVSMANQWSGSFPSISFVCRAEFWRSSIQFERFGCGHCLCIWSCLWIDCGCIFWILIAAFLIGDFRLGSLLFGKEQRFRSDFLCVWQ